MPMCGLLRGRECGREEPCYDHWNAPDDAGAIKHLEGRGFSTHQFIIRPPQGIEITEVDKAAICLLLREWDWGYEGPELE